MQTFLIWRTDYCNFALTVVTPFHTFQIHSISSTRNIYFEKLSDGQMILLSSKYTTYMGWNSYSQCRCISTS